MSEIQKYLAVWWIRIVSFFVLSAFFYLAYSAVAGFTHSVISYFLPIFFASVIIEHLRKDSIFYLFGIMINLSTPKEFVFGLVLAFTNIAMIGGVAYFYTDDISVQLLINSDWYLIFFSTFFAAGFTGAFGAATFFTAGLAAALGAAFLAAGFAAAAGFFALVAMSTSISDIKENF